MNCLTKCDVCEQELMVLDIEAQLLQKECEFYVVKKLYTNETWDNFNELNEFASYCECCFMPRLESCRKRVIGAR